MEKTILIHLENPTAAPIYKTAKKRDFQYFWFPVGNYVVFYVVKDDIMEVRRLIYRARNLDALL